MKILPSQYEDEDYFRLNEILAAQSKEDRPQTGRQFASEFGQKGGFENWQSK